MNIIIVFCSFFAHFTTQLIVIKEVQNFTGYHLLLAPISYQLYGGWTQLVLPQGELITFGLAGLKGTHR